MDDNASWGMDSEYFQSGAGPKRPPLRQVPCTSIGRPNEPAGTRCYARTLSGVEFDSAFAGCMLGDAGASTGEKAAGVLSSIFGALPGVVSAVQGKPAAAKGGGGSPASGGSSGGGGVGAWFKANLPWVIAGVVVLGGGTVLVMRKRRRR